MDKYQIEAEKLAKAIDIANELDVIRHDKGKMPDDKLKIRQTINSVLKEQIFNPPGNLRNLDSLNETVRLFLREYHTSKGQDIEYFWDKIKEYGLGYERLNWQGASLWGTLTKEILMLRGSIKYPMDKYQIEAEKFAKASDIANEAAKIKHAKGKTSEEQFKTTIDAHILWKTMALYPEQRFRKISSLKYHINSLLTYFNEATGEDVEYFWAKIKENDIGYQRVDMMAKIFRKKRISNMNEYDFAVDVLVPAQQLGEITAEQAQLLDKYITQYQNRRKRK